MTFTIDQTGFAHWLLLLAIAALAGLLVELLRGGTMPLGFVGGVVSAFIGAWLFSDVLSTRLSFSIPPTYDNVIVIPAAIGGLLVAFIWSLLGGRGGRR